MGIKLILHESQALFVENINNFLKRNPKVNFKDEEKIEWKVQNKRLLHYKRKDMIELMNTIIPAIAPFIIMVLVAIFALMMINWRARHFDYQCEICGAIFSLPFSAAITSIHMMGRKYVKCPNCGQWCWANPVPKE